MNLFDLTGNKAIVTGGTRGLGRGIAEGLMEAGAEVVIVGSSTKVFDVSDEYCAKGFVCHGVEADLSAEENLAPAFEKAMKFLGGGLDIMVNAAGVNRRNRSDMFTKEDWDYVLAVNLNATFYLCQMASREMLKSGYGKIINISSMTAFFGGQNVPAYSASKGAVTQMTKNFANDLAQFGICANCIAPGFMATEMNTALLDRSKPRYQQVTDRIPIGRWGDGNDLKGAAIFLASHASDYVTGVNLPVDGGYLSK
ncbi:MAG: SDR family oxidoreductase [Oscillospiraceae bacterium]